MAFNACRYGCEGMHSWIPFLDVLLQHFNIVLVDNPGIGNVALKNIDINELAKENHQIMLDLGVNKYDVVGHSLGGYIA